jgi:hypothetical protein
MEILGIDVTDLPVPKRTVTPKSPTKVLIETTKCPNNHNSWLNYQPECNPAYCNKNNILHGVQCQECGKRLVTGNKKMDEEEFDKGKFYFDKDK